MHSWIPEGSKVKVIGESNRGYDVKCVTTGVIITECGYNIFRQPEKIDLHKVFSEHNNYVSHLILDSDISKLTSAVDVLKDIHNATISVCINGMEVRMADLEPILENWATRLCNEKLASSEDYKERVALLQTEEGLLKKAKELAKDMCCKMAEKFEF